MEKLTKENYYTYPALSNSMMNWILPETGGSVKKFQERSLFPQEEGDSAAMRLGTLVHKYVETASYDIFKICAVPSPSIAKICEAVAQNPITDLDSQILSAARELDFQPTWKDETVINKVKEQGGGYLFNLKEAKEKGIILVTEEEMKQIKAIGDNIAEVIPWNFDRTGEISEQYKQMFGADLEFFNELPVEFVYQDILCKSLIDIVVIDHHTKRIKLIDLKTTSTPISLYCGYKMHEYESADSEKIVEREVEGVMYKRYVHRQLAFYSLAIESKFPGYLVDKLYVLAAETNAPYDVKLEEVSSSHIMLGICRVDKAIHTLFSNSLMTTSL